MEKHQATEKPGEASSSLSDTATAAGHAVPTRPPHMNGMAHFQQAVMIPWAALPYNEVVINTADQSLPSALSGPYANMAAQNSHGYTAPAPGPLPMMAAQGKRGSNSRGTAAPPPNYSYPPFVFQHPRPNGMLQVSQGTTNGAEPMNSQGSLPQPRPTNGNQNGTTYPPHNRARTTQAYFSINGEQRRGPDSGKRQATSHGHRPQQQQQPSKKPPAQAPTRKKPKTAGQRKRSLQNSNGKQNAMPAKATAPQRQHDRQFISLLNPFDAPLYKEWQRQMSPSLVAFLRSIEAFVIAEPYGMSPCPYSAFLRTAWRQAARSAGDWTDDPAQAATGLCCAACLQKRNSSFKDFVQFVDFDDHDEVLRVLRKLSVHVRFCPYAHTKLPLLNNRYFSIQNDADWLALGAFTEWFCEYMCAEGAIERGIQVSAPSKRIRIKAFDAVAHYKALEEASDEAFQDMELALSGIAHTKDRNKGLLALDLTEVPSEDENVEFPFYCLLQEHVEIVRLTSENARHHESLMKETSAGPLVLFQCRCCHGKPLVGDDFTALEKRSYILFDAGDRTKLVCSFVELAYHHLKACPEVSPRSKERMGRVKVLTSSCDFDRLAKFLLAQITEWDKYVKAEIDQANAAAAVPPCEDVRMWRPVSDLMEECDSSLWSKTQPTPTRIRIPRDFECDDVLEGFDGAHSYVGNMRFRKLVSGMRSAFLSMSAPNRKEDIVKAVLNSINAKGGSFRRLNADGVWTLLLDSAAEDRIRTALEKGFSDALLPYSPRRGGGVGANVLECELSPMYDVLSGRKRGSIVATIPVHVKSSAMTASASGVSNSATKRHCRGSVNSSY